MYTRGVNALKSLPYLDTHTSKPEAILIKELLRRGIPAQSQVPIGGGHKLGGAVIDIYIPTNKVGVRIQGDYFHGIAEARRRDAAQYIYLAGLGLRIVDIWERDIYQRLDWVINQITGGYING